MAKNRLPVANKKPVPVTIVSNSTTSNAMPKESMERERKWKAEDALRDIERAEQHKCDKALMKDVKKLAIEKMNSLKKI